MEAASQSRGSYLVPALIGLLGVIIGGLLTSGIAYLGDERGRHEEERASVRLVALEIATNSEALLDLALDGRPRYLPHMSNAVWRREQTTLARYLTSAEWNAVAEYYARFDHLTRSLRSLPCVPVAERGADVRAAARVALRALDAPQSALRLAEDEPPADMVRRSCRLNWTPPTPELEPPADPQTATHARVVVDGKEWAVRTYRNREGKLCLFHGAPRTSEDGTCLDRNSLFEQGPVVLNTGAGQDAGDLARWDRAWVWGIASKRVAKLDLTLTNCTVLPLHPDAAGIFQHESPAAELHRGVLPAKVVARGAGGKVIFEESVKLETPDGTVPRTGAC